MKAVFCDVEDIGPDSAFNDPTAVVVLPYIDQELADKVAPVLTRRALRDDGLLVMAHDTARRGFIAVANIVFAKSASPFFGYLAQDVFPGDGWFKSGIATLQESGASLLPFSDGRFYGNIATFGLVRRDWVKGLYHNFLFFPGYNSHFGDTEISAIAWDQGKAIFNPGCMMCEVDYEKHTRKNNPKDEALYRARARSGFGGVISPFDPE